MQRVLRMLGQTVEFKQRIIDRPRPSHLDTLGLAVAVRSQCQDVARRTGKTCEIEAQEDLDDLDAVTSIDVSGRSRSAGERRGSGGRMLISDDGAGVAGNALDLGLIEMRERMSVLGGTLTLNARQNGGTGVDAYPPVHP